ncbi:MAG: CidA/LrgA family protein [Coriobacteriia bacterium]|nr:CidA/LrgA family protein [Coriobacteriia bacterium]MBS5477387.1 CidA/LrgA family protein [Coriobacteriia bacterium]
MSAPNIRHDQTGQQALPSDAAAIASPTDATRPSEEPAPDAHPVPHHELFGIPVPQSAHDVEVVAHLARRTAKRKVNKAVRIVLELGLILAICLAGEQVSELLPFDMPSNICSMILLLVFLISGVLRMDNISDGADFLLDHMSIFFIPAAVAIMGSFDLLAGNILKLFVICLITTVLVFFVTSFTVSTVMNLMMRHDAKVAEEVGLDGSAVAMANVVEMATAIQAYARRRSEGESSEAALYEAEAEATSDTAKTMADVRTEAGAPVPVPEIDALTARLAAEAEASHNLRWRHRTNKTARHASPPSTDATREAEEREAEHATIEKLASAARAASSAHRHPPTDPSHPEGTA